MEGYDIKMTNGDWEKFGESIKNTIQDAIDSQDFEKLNQTITDTINNAANGFAEGMKNASESFSKNMQTYTRVKPPRQPYSEGRQQRQTYTSARPQNRSQARPQTREGINLYRRKTASKVWGYIFLAVGGIFGICFGILFVLAMIGIIIDPTDLAFGLLSVCLVLGVPMIGSMALLLLGTVMVSRVGRYERYIWAIGDREFCNIKEIANRCGRKEKLVAKDLDYMIRKGWFIQGHLDQNKTCLIVTHKMYDQYLRLENDKMRAKREEEEKKAQAQEQSSYEKMDPQVRRVIEEGDEYIRKIHACNDAIPGEEISAKISRMELLIDRIFDRVEQSPESVGDIRRLMEYYLPTTIKLLEAYEDLDAQPIDGENIRSSKAEIEATLDTLNTAFEKLLDDLFQDTAWDVSSDISVLHTMLAQEGLKEEEWKK